MKEYVKNYKYNDNSDDKVYILVKFDVEKQDHVDVIFSLDVNDRDSYRVVDEYSLYYDMLKQEKVNYTLVY